MANSCLVDAHGGFQSGKYAVGGEYGAARVAHYFGFSVAVVYFIVHGYDALEVVVGRGVDVEIGAQVV